MDTATLFSLFLSLHAGHCNGLTGSGFGGSLEDLNKMLTAGPNGSGIGRKSQNMTECVPVPTSEHVAEIVGRQGKLIFRNFFFILLLNKTSRNHKVTVTAGNLLEVCNYSRSMHLHMQYVNNM